MRIYGASAPVECQSLALAVEAGCQVRVEPGPFLVVDDTYRCVRRRLHDSNIKKGGVRERYSCGTVQSLQKGVIIGTSKGKIGQLCGEDRGRLRYRGIDNKRQSVSELTWINRIFKMKGDGGIPPQDKPCGSLP